MRKFMESHDLKLDSWTDFISATYVIHAKPHLPKVQELPPIVSPTGSELATLTSGTAKDDAESFREHFNPSITA